MIMNSSHLLYCISCYPKLPGGNDEVYSVITSVPGADCSPGELLFTSHLNVAYGSCTGWRTGFSCWKHFNSVFCSMTNIL